MTPRDIEAIVAGHLCLDIIPRFSGDPRPPSEVFVPGSLVDVGAAAISTGGAVSNTGIAMAKLGVRTTLMAGVGDDDFGTLVRRIVADAADDEGLVVVPQSHTSYTLVIALPGADRFFLHSTGANDEFGSEHVDEALCRRARLFHFGYPPLMRRMYSDGGAELVEIFKKAKGAGAVTSLDMSMPDINSAAGKMDWRPLYERLLPHVDFFLPSIEEALLTAEREKLERLKAEGEGRDVIDLLDGADYTALSSRFLEWGAAVVALKSGHRGIYIRTASRERLEAMGEGGIDRVSPIDVDNWSSREFWSLGYRAPEGGSATGAGDCAVAGFLTAYLRGETIESAVQCANAAAHQSLHSLDATGGIRGWDETLRIARDSHLERIEFELRSPRWRFDMTASRWVKSDS